MARAVASEDEEPGRSVLSCAPSLGLVRDTVFPTPVGSVHSPFLLWPRLLQIPQLAHLFFPLSNHPVYTYCLGDGWCGKGTPALEEANHRKMEPSSHSSYCLKDGVTRWRWDRGNGRGSPHCLGRKRGSNEKTISSRLSEVQEGSPQEVYQQNVGRAQVSGSGHRCGA